MRSRPFVRNAQGKRPYPQRPEVHSVDSAMKRNLEPACPIIPDLAHFHRSALKRRWPALLPAAAALMVVGSLSAAPYRPTDDGRVLVQLPAPASDPRSRRVKELRQQLQREPRRADLAGELVDLHLARLLVEGDPRDAGYARATLAPWWNDPAAPPQLRIARAVLKQFNHDFEGARADLQAVVAQDPDQTQAWAWIAAIAMVQADYGRARQACEQGTRGLSPLQRTACLATVAAATGSARAAAQELGQALADEPDAPPELRLWALTRLAETQERLGAWDAAEGAYRQALDLGLNDSYLLAAYADFLLDRGRPAEVITLLQGRERNDLHLLRLALAARALNDPRGAGWEASLAARFDAARLRGDSVHQKEEARFRLELLGDTAGALPLAAANYTLQREAADARMLLQAALAARRKDAAAPALDWLARSGFESHSLSALAAQLKALP